MKILDAGCGRGEALDKLCTEKNANLAVGIDKSPRFIRDAADSANGSMNFILGSIEHLPFKPNKFDEVSCVHVLEHVDNPEKVINEFRYCIRPHGKLFISVPHPRIEQIVGKRIDGYFGPNMHQRIFSRDELVNLVEKHGFIKKDISNTGFFIALFNTYRFILLNDPFEMQSGRSYSNRNYAAYFFGMLDVLSTLNEKELKDYLEVKGMNYLFIPIALIARVLHLITCTMANLYANNLNIICTKGED